MKKIQFAAFFLLLIPTLSLSQTIPDANAQKWADSVFNSLNNDQRIAQLMVLRESSFSKNGPVYYEKAIENAIEKYNIGGIVLFQGSPVKQANFINHFQSIAQTPLMVCIDGEWGLGMRMDSVAPLNRQMMMGAMNDASIVYDYGTLVGEQCKRMGIHVNYAPVVDINNNPNNPVINDRSFGEDKYKVARFGIAYMQGMQDKGVLACAKHFPGHGDVSVDSHLDLPVINKSREELDSLELYPFRKMIDAGVGSIMVAHLFIPAIDNTAHTATSISKKSVTGILRNDLNYKGLTFTDALGMQGVAKYFPGGQIAAQSLIAGNDMLCLPEDVPNAIASIKKAIRNKKLSWDDIYEKCKKVLAYKYMYGVAQQQPINTTNLTSDLNKGIEAMKTRVAENAITLLKRSDWEFFPLSETNKNEKEIAYVGIGLSGENAFASRMKNDYNADVFYFDYNENNSRLLSIVELIKDRYKKVVIGVHNYNRFPANQFGISDNALKLIHEIQKNNKTVVFTFGNPYALKYFCEAGNLFACYDDDPITQEVAADILNGIVNPKGTLPVTVCDEYHYGSGIVIRGIIQKVHPEVVGMDVIKLRAIDSIVRSGIEGRAFPGAVVLAAKDGKIFYEKAFGNFNYDGNKPVRLNTIFDMASVTKICATTISVLKLIDEGKIKLNETLGTYLPWVRNSNKKDLPIDKILLHQAGLVAWIPFYKETIDTSGKPLHAIYRTEKSDSFSVRVAQNLFMRTDWVDTMYKRILDSELGPMDKYIYSDNDFIFLGKIVEQISGMTLDEYATENFYKPMGLSSTGFKPRDKFDTNRIAPTEFEQVFRLQHLHGDVHDPGAAMFGGIAGHAGLFSTANNLVAILQMLLNGGTFKGEQYLSPENIKLFTAYNSPISRRGLGFDKPQKDNYTTADWDPYPSRFASPLTFGHTGYTGTGVWVDPKYDLVYVFLSNRVNPEGGTNLQLYKMNIRGEIEDALYKAMVPPVEEVLKREAMEIKFAPAK